MAANFPDYYEQEWKIKLSLPKYSTLDVRWRSRWDFAREHIIPQSKVLDVACGDGVLGKFLIEEKKCEVHGIDIAEYALNISKQKGIITEFCDMSNDKFPYEDNFFDCAVLSCSLEHVMDPIHALSETKRVLKPSGIMIITLPNVVYFWNRIWFMFGKVSLDLLHTNPGEGMHLQFYNYKSEFEQRVMTKMSGLRIVKKKGDLKNPKKYSDLQRSILYFFIKIWPNMFAQYTHWIIKKEGENETIIS